MTHAMNPHEFDRITVVEGFKALAAG